jgi:hypothetical protein
MSKRISVVEGSRETMRMSLILASPPRTCLRSNDGREPLATREEVLPCV